VNDIPRFNDGQTTAHVKGGGTPTSEKHRTVFRENMKTNGGLYIHIPYCASKCRYCDFYSVPAPAPAMKKPPLQDYPAMLIREACLRAAEPAVLGDEIYFDSIFFGGGTPSLLEAPEVRAILEAMRENYEMSGQPEITMECNPGTVDAAKLEGYLETGVNRLSFGVQSFRQSDLTALGRIHTPAQAIESLELAKKAGFSNIGLDLMFSLPYQSVEDLDENIEKAIALEPQHISCYCLTIEDGTPLAAEAKADPGMIATDEVQAKQYSLAAAKLKAAGYERYEVSNFAKPGFECRHNLTYWQGRPYMGFGPSAHSYIKGKRSWNVPDIDKYAKRISNDETAVEGEEILSRQQELTEFVFLGLRSRGIDPFEFKKKFGVNFSELYGRQINSLVGKGLAREQPDGSLALTDKGYLLCDEIASLFI